jgi:ubiquinone/menaquinone biosynthesis C-methylase UbiE
MTEDMLMDWVPPGGTVLDVGCGGGRWCRATARVAEKVTGIDRNEAVISAARESSPQSNLSYIVGDVSSALAGQMAGEFFDVVLLVHVLEHIDEAGALLTALRGVAKRLVVEVPDFEGDRLNLLRYNLETRYYSDADHVREYTTEILLCQLKRNGWKVPHHQRFRGSIVAIAESDLEIEE